MPQGVWGGPRLACDWRQHGSAPPLPIAVGSRAVPRPQPLATLDQAGLGGGIQTDGGQLLGPSSARGLRASTQPVTPQTMETRMSGPHYLQRALDWALLGVPPQAFDGLCVAGVANRWGVARAFRGRWRSVPSGAA